MKIVIGFCAAFLFFLCAALALPAIEKAYVKFKTSDIYTPEWQYDGGHPEPRTRVEEDVRSAWIQARAEQTKREAMELWCLFMFAVIGSVLTYLWLRSPGKKGNTAPASPDSISFAAQGSARSGQANVGPTA